MIIGIIFLANVLHLSNPAAVAMYGPVDGYGTPVTPQNHPLWDTMITMLNHEEFPVVARITIWNEQTGAKVVWPETGLDHRDETLLAKLSWAVSFIPDNGWHNPPHDFVGFALVEFYQKSPFGLMPLDHANVWAWVMLGSGNFDNHSPAIETPNCKDLPTQSSWYFAYAIPRYDDPNHYGSDAYTTGLHIPNFGDTASEVTVRYRVGQRYAEAGQSWSFTKTVEPKHAARFDLFSELLAVGYPPNLNSEGHVEITTARPAQLFPNAVIGTKTYLFSAAQGFCR
ncbi:MAG TPA: hypothetical protein VE422_46035 [Terriglobia bacterium]|nr:hypothetical protein [Terriglobia bacterium]